MACITVARWQEGTMQAVPKRGQGCVPLRVLKPIEDPAYKRKAIAVRAAAGQPDNRIAGLDARGAPNLSAVGDTDGEAGQIVFADVVSLAHLRQFAANQRAADLFTL